MEVTAEIQRVRDVHLRTPQPQLNFAMKLAILHLLLPDRLRDLPLESLLRDSVGLLRLTRGILNLLLDLPLQVALLLLRLTRGVRDFLLDLPLQVAILLLDDTNLLLELTLQGAFLRFELALSRAILRFGSATAGLFVAIQFRR